MIVTTLVDEPILIGIVVLLAGGFLWWSCRIQISQQRLFVRVTLHILRFFSVVAIAAVLAAVSAVVAVMIGIAVQGYGSGIAILYYAPMFFVLYLPLLSYLTAVLSRKKA